MKINIEDLDSFVDFAITVRKQRRKQGLSGAEFAKKVGISPTAVCNIELHYMVPSAKTIVKIAEVLRIDEKKLLKLAKQQWLRQCAQSWDGKISRDLSAPDWE